MPLLVARVPASVSTACNDLMEALNAVRLANHTGMHDKVFALECSLRNLNHGQGIGFAVFGPGSRLVGREIVFRNCASSNQLGTNLRAPQNSHDNRSGTTTPGSRKYVIYFGRVGIQF